MKNLRTLGDMLGSVTYLGRCFRCGVQFMSRRDRVGRSDGRSFGLISTINASTGWDRKRRNGRLVCERCTPEKRDEA